MKILIINGPNINMLGIREPDIYGRQSYSALCDEAKRHCEDRNAECEIFQSNHEGSLVDRIQQAYSDGTDGIVINPGAYTHTSIALYDAMLAVGLPAVEVHISDVSKRESFRSISYIRPACIGSVIGRGIAGYSDAIDILINRLSEVKSE